MTRKLIFGWIVVVAALVFSILSFVEPKSNLIIKPSSFEDLSHLGFYMYRQILPRLAEEAHFVFFLEDFEKEKKVVEGFLSYGKQKESRLYQIHSNYPWEDAIPFEGPVDYQKPEIEDGFSHWETQVYILPLDAIGKYQWTKNTYFFYAKELDSLDHLDCDSKAKAFDMLKASDRDCFVNAVLHRYRKFTDKNPEKRSIGAFEEIARRKFLFHLYLVDHAAEREKDTAL